MLNFEKIEKIAAELEEKLGLDSEQSGDALIDKAEEMLKEEEAKTDDAKGENLGAEIEKQVEEEKKNTEVPEESFAASEEAPAETPAEVPAETPVEAEEEEFDVEGAKACQASLKKLIKIAQTVKMSKDMPACKKQEVLSKIQKASEKLINAAKGDEDEDGSDTYTTQNMKKKNTKVTSMSLKRGITPKAIGKLMRNPSATMSRIFKKVGDKMDVNIPVSRMTATMFVNLLAALEEALVEMD